MLRPASANQLDSVGQAEVECPQRNMYMKRNLIYIGICLTVLFTASLGMGKDRKGNLTGTWDCKAHGGALGDMAFTLYLQENKETVDGSIASPMGSTQITSGTLRHFQVEFHFDLPQGSYTLMGKLAKGKLWGGWSLDSDKGLWEGTKRGAAGK